jgi:ADP-heptose:LPS heptosyltransferase
LLDTAKAIEGLDLVITVDTAVAHLSGAMGVPTWLLLNTMGQDFRWGRTGDETPWYPSMRLFRRALGEQWTDVMKRVAEALRG